MRKVLFGTALIMLTACGTVQEETFSTLTIDGRDYTLRTQTIAGPQGTFTTHAIKSQNGSYRSCDPNTPRSCRAAFNTHRSRPD